MSGMRIVIADDDQLMASCIADMVRDCGFEPVSVVTSGGVAALQACQENDIDVVITDVHMPQLNGLNILHTLRARSKAKCPFIVLVSGAFAANDPLIQHASPDAFLSKPLHAHGLKDVLDHCMARTGKSHTHRPLLEPGV